MQTIHRILVIRRDNIGDLICTTPLLSQLRQAYPHAQLDILVNSYNSAAIALNPDVNQVYIYTKSKHRTKGQTLWRIYWQRFQLMRQLKQQHYDVILLAGGFSPHAERLAQQIKAPMIIGCQPSQGISQVLTHPISIPATILHEVERTSYLLTALTLEPKPPALTLYSQPELQNQFKQNLIQTPWYQDRPIIGLHISTRKIDQRWPAEYFIELIQLLSQQYSYQFMLFWSPGDENNKHHPGDDQKAQQIMQAVANLPVFPCPTQKVEELIAALSLCDAVICSDGGAMHIAAGLGKPIVCFFGSSNAAQWHPWSVPHVVLQPASHQVIDIKPTQVKDALATLCCQ